MRLGGFVIHGNSRPTLGRCLESLKAVCDHVVAIDSESEDGSFALAHESGVEARRLRWQGFGAARAAAAELLTPSCDYLLYLDSDEWLEPPAVAAIQALRSRGLEGRGYTVRRRNWAAKQSGGQYLFRTDTRWRIIHRDFAVWRPSMVVHEALPSGPRAASGAYVEHGFALDPAYRLEKDLRYALLWAVQAHAEGRRAKPPSIQRAAAWIRDGLLNGAVFRGGAEALSLTTRVSRYHALKHAYLRQVRAGGFPRLVEAYAQARYDALWALVAEAVRSEGAATDPRTATSRRAS